MPREPKAYLHDIGQAAALIAEFTEGLDFEAYAADAMVRAAVEREFEIIGEALGQRAKLDPEMAGSISEHRRIIAFRPRPRHRLSEIQASSRAPRSGSPLASCLTAADGDRQREALATRPTPRPPGPR